MNECFFEEDEKLWFLKAKRMQFFIPTIAECFKIHFLSFNDADLHTSGGKGENESTSKVN